MNSRPGSVTLIGAGPGDPGLITVAGLKALRRAEVVIYDRLVSPQLLEQAREDAELIDAGKSPGDHKIKQEEINALIVAHAQRGKRVVRLKGGDPFVFGRGSDEVDACRVADVPCRVIPGISSAIAGPAAAGIPVTDRRHARTVAFVTGRTVDDLDFEEEAARYRAISHVDTIVILMSRGSIAASTSAIISAGRDPRTPAAAIQSATTPQQRMVTGTLGGIADLVHRAALEAPLLTVIGDVATFAQQRRVRDGLLVGRRIVLTRPRGASREMAKMLRMRGATVISCPLIRISFDVDSELLDAALRRMKDYAWLVVTSQHAVLAIEKRLAALQLDARIFGSTRIAAIGPATATALRRIGLCSDFMPPVHTGDALVSELNSTHALRDARVFYPRADIAGAALAERMRTYGAVVDDVVAYATLPCVPPAWSLAQLAEENNAIVFSSPSAVRQFAALRLNGGSAKIACIGPTTARAAGACGLVVDIVAADHSGRGLVDELTQYFEALAITP